MPHGWQLQSLSHQVFVDNAWTNIPAINSGAGDTVPSVIPPRIGGYSPIKHIVVIVKENRTYDQVLGDLKNANGQPLGNGDPADAQFGQPITPNQHALAQRFGDLDNFYDEERYPPTATTGSSRPRRTITSRRSSARSTGPIHRRPATRSPTSAMASSGTPPSGQGSASRTSVSTTTSHIACRALPEIGMTTTPPRSTWRRTTRRRTRRGRRCLRTSSRERRSARTTSTARCSPARRRTSRRSRRSTDPDFPNFQLGIPDQYRVDTWLPVFSKEVNDHSVPSLSFMWLMTDHTTGSAIRYPVAQVADNDLAVGRVVDAVCTARTGRARRSSSSRTTRRTAWTTSTATAVRCSSSARTRSRASTTPTTPRSTWCGRSSRSSASSR